MKFYNAFHKTCKEVLKHALVYKAVVMHTHLYYFPFSHSITWCP